MPKQGEVDYLRLIGEEGTRFALNKPFSDPECGRLLIELGTLLALLPPPPARLLDLGVGTGWTSAFFAKRGYEVVGQDISADMIEQAYINKERYQASNVSFVAADYEQLDYRDEFDCAVFYDCLHHSEDEKAALRTVFKALKPGGVCLTVEPGKGHATAPHSVEAMARYGVTERDMPPGLIIESAASVGFRHFRVFQRPSGPLEIPSPCVNGRIPFFRGLWAQIFALKNVPPFRGWRRGKRLLQNALKESHIVLLQK